MIESAFDDSRSDVLVLESFEKKMPSQKMSAAFRYAIVSYSKLSVISARKTKEKIDKFLTWLGKRVGLVIVDEVHQVKCRTGASTGEGSARNEEEKMTEDTPQEQVETVTRSKLSRRREVTQMLIQRARHYEEGCKVLALSGTPVVNNLEEAKSLLEMVSGKTQDDLKCTPNVDNCMAMHQRLMQCGLRFVGDPVGKPKMVRTDCSAAFDGLKGAQMLDLEKALTQARLPKIVEAVKAAKRETEEVHGGGIVLLYTHFVGNGIKEMLRDALDREGLKVAFFTGSESRDVRADLLSRFKSRQTVSHIDVVIGTSAVATGVDSLQNVCSHLVINGLPWTHSAYRQLGGTIAA